MTIVETTLANGGGTFVPATLQPAQIDSGYAVAMPGYTTIVPLSQFNEARVEDYVSRYVFSAHLDRNPDVHVGTWVHDGDVYLDLSEVFKDRDLALEVARERNELAVWDFARNSEIPLTERTAA